MIRYAITDPAFTPRHPDLFRTSLETAVHRFAPSHLCFRDKTLGDIDLKHTLSTVLVDVAARYAITSVIHGDSELAARCGAGGVHLTSRQLTEITPSRRKNLRVFCSTHTLDEIIYCTHQGADAATFSPIFDSPGKGAPLGTEALIRIVTSADIPIIALGGVTTEAHIASVIAAGAGGFASIRYFFDDGPEASA